MTTTSKGWEVKASGDTLLHSYHKLHEEVLWKLQPDCGQRLRMRKVVLWTSTKIQCMGQSWKVNHRIKYYKIFDWPQRRQNGGEVDETKEVKSLSRVQLFATPWTVAHQAPPSMEFSRQEYWSGLPFPSPGDLPHPGIEPGSPALWADALLSEPPGNPRMKQKEMAKRKPMALW